MLAFSAVKLRAIIFLPVGIIVAFSVWRNGLPVTQTYRSRGAWTKVVAILIVVATILGCLGAMFDDEIKAFIERMDNPHR